MSVSDVGRVRALAVSFRAAILRTNRNKLPISFRAFPLGSCSDASLLLARFLDDVGYGPATYVIGWRGPCSHAWLELDGLLIDITADQFVRDPEKLLWTGVPPEFPDGVIVTAEENWHSGFDEEHRYTADYWVYGDSIGAELDRSYHEILTSLQNVS